MQRSVLISAALAFVAAASAFSPASLPALRSTRGECPPRELLFPACRTLVCFLLPTHRPCRAMRPRAATAPGAMRLRPSVASVYVLILCMPHMTASRTLVVSQRAACATCACSRTTATNKLGRSVSALRSTPTASPTSGPSSPKCRYYPVSEAVVELCGLSTSRACSGNRAVLSTCKMRGFSSG